VIAAGLLAAWRGPRWAVMSARFDRPAPRAGAASLAPATAYAGSAPAAHGTAAASGQATVPAPAATPGPAAAHPPPDDSEPRAGARDPDGEAAALWEALDRGDEL
jgi:hypothetical protein